MKKIVRIIALLLLTGLAALSGAVAEEPKSDPRASDSVKAVLQGAVNRPVALLLASGQEVSGTVTKVGERVVYLTKLTGRDYSEAVVLMDRVDAVIFKVWGK